MNHAKSGGHRWVLGSVPVPCPPFLNYRGVKKQVWAEGRSAVGTWAHTFHPFLIT